MVWARWTWPIDAAATGVNEKWPEVAIPTVAPVGVEHRDHLAHRHRPGIGAQARQDVAELGRQQVAGVHRQQLSDLHRRPAHLRQLIGDPAGIGRREQQVADPGAFALGELPRTFGQPCCRRPPRRAIPRRASLPSDRRGPASAESTRLIVSSYGTASTGCAAATERETSRKTAIGNRQPGTTGDPARPDGPRPARDRDRRRRPGPYHQHDRGGDCHGENGRPVQDQDADRDDVDGRDADEGAGVASGPGSDAGDDRRHAEREASGEQDCGQPSRRGTSPGTALEAIADG